MRYRLPPLSSLRIFEAVMRRGSIRQGADELCLTPQAVSQQLKQLEQFVGQPLFVRGVRSIAPTPAATILDGYVRSAFDDLSQGLAAVQHAVGHDTLRLYVSPYFATSYLVPNLRDFTERHPGLTLTMSVGVEMIDMEAGAEVDGIIHWRYGQSHNLVEVPLIEDLKVLVVSPELARRVPVLVPEDLLRHTLVTPLVANHLWPDTLRLLNLTYDKLPPTMSFSSNAAMLEATLAGLGVGLVSYKDAMREIASGRLVAPFGVDLLSGLPYEQTPRFSLFYRKAASNLAVLMDFRDWLLRHVCQTEMIGYASRCQSESAA